MSYNLREIDNLINEAFDDDQLTDLCQYDFPSVYEQFTEGQKKKPRIRMLVDHAKRQREIPKLLEVVKQRNPKVYAEFEPRLKVLTYPIENSSDGLILAVMYKRPDEEITLGDLLEFLCIDRTKEEIVEKVKTTLRELDKQELISYRPIGEGKSQTALLKLLSGGRSAVTDMLPGLAEELAQLDTLRQQAEEVENDFNTTEILKKAEQSYLQNLRAQILKLYTGRKVIELDTDIAEPEPEQVDTSFFLRASRHEVMLLMQSSDHQESEPKSVSVYEAAATHKFLVILGSPGAGKSWMLNDIALRQINNYEAGNVVAMPLLVNAKHWQPDQSPVDFLHDGLQRILVDDDHSAQSNVLLQRFDSDLAAGRYLVLIDALNEMPNRRVPRIQQDTTRMRSEYSQEQVEAARVAFKGKVGDEREWQLGELVESTGDTRYIVTCRSLDYEPRTIPWSQARVRPLNSIQVNEFIHSRLIGLPLSTEELMTEMSQNPFAKSLSENPFYLDIMIAVYIKEQGLSRTRSKLLDELVSLRLQQTLEKEIAEEEINSAYSRCRDALCRLSLRMLEEGFAGAWAPAKLIDPADETNVQLAIKAGLVSRTLREETEDSISFYHELIQEYFAAAGLAEGFKKISLNKILRDQRWAEVIALWIELEPDQRKRNHLYKSVLKGIYQRAGFFGTGSMSCLPMLLFFFLGPFFWCVLAAVLTEFVTQPGFALRMLKENPYLMFSIAFLIPVVVPRILQAVAVDWVVQKNALHIVGIMPYRDTVPQAVERIIWALRRSDAIRAQIFVDALVSFGELGRERLHQELDSTSTTVRFAAALALARMKDTREAKKMVEIFSGDDYITRDIPLDWRRSLLTTWYGIRNIGKWLRNHSRIWLILPVIQGSGEALATHYIKLLRESQYSPQMQSFPNLMRMQSIFTQMLAFQGNLPTTVGIILRREFLDDPEVDAVSLSMATTMLGKVGDAESVRQVLEMITQGSIPTTQINNVLSQFNFVRQDAVPILVEKLHDSNDAVRRYAVLLLGMTKDKSVASELVDMLDDPNISVRLTTVDALWEMQPSEAIEPLRKLIGDLQDLVLAIAKKRKQAIDALGKLESIQAIESLQNLLQVLQNDTLNVNDVSAAVADADRALQDVEIPDAIEPLKQLGSTLQSALNKTDFELLCRSIYLLGCLKAKDDVVTISGALDWTRQALLASDDMRRLTLVVLQSLEHLDTSDASAYVGDIVLVDNQDKSVLIQGIQVLKSTKSAQAIDILENIDTSDQEVRLEVVEALKELGIANRRRATTVLQKFLSDVNPKVKRAANDAYIQLEPATSRKIVLTSATQDVTLVDRIQKGLLNVTGLETFDVFGRMWWSVMKKVLQQQSASQIVVTGKIKLGASNEYTQYLNQQQMIAQEMAQMSADSIVNTNNRQRWLSSLLIFGLPFFLIVLGLLYTLRIPGIALGALHNFHPLLLPFLISILIVSTAALPNSRKAARTWFIPAMIGLIVGFNLYGYILPLIHWLGLPLWAWIVGLLVYLAVTIHCLWLFNLENRDGLSDFESIVFLVETIFVLLPVAPFLLPLVAVVDILDRIYDVQKNQWWKIVVLATTGGWTAFFIVALLTERKILPGYWQVGIWVVITLSMVLFYFSTPASLSNQIGGFIAAIPGSPGLPALFWWMEEINRLESSYVTDEPEAMKQTELMESAHFGDTKRVIIEETDSQVDVGYETLFHLLALLPAAYIYNSIYHWSMRYLATNIILTVVLVGLVSYVAYSFLRKGNLQTAAFIIGLPSNILLSVWRIVAFILKLLSQLTPSLLDIVVKVLELIPSRITQFIAELLWGLPSGMRIAAILGTALGVSFAVDLGRRLLSIIPITWLPFLLPTLLVWIILLPLGRRSFQQGNYITFMIIMWLIMLPLFPSLTIIAVMIVGALLFDYLLQNAEEAR